MSGQEEQPQYIRIDSGQFRDLKITIEDVMQWLVAIYNLSGVNKLRMALDLCYPKMGIITDGQRTAVTTIASFIYLEASGKLKPPIDLFETYDKIATQGGLM